MAVRMRAQCNTLLHCVAAHIHSGIHKSLGCIVPAFKKVCAVTHYACRSCVRLSHNTYKGILASIKMRLHNQRFIGSNNISISLFIPKCLQ
jgi:hypothetical protein